MQSKLLPRVALATGLLLSGSAMAHTGPLTHGGLAAGLLHPFTGLDHLLVMFGVCLWSARLGSGRIVLLMPLLFLGFLATGFGLGMAGLGLPGLEAGIAASVLVIGMVIAMQRAMVTPPAAGLIIVAALLHGSAHGLEMPAGSAVVPFLGGVLAVSLMLHLAGLASGRVLANRPGLLRVFGLVTGLIGGGLLLGA